MILVPTSAGFPEVPPEHRRRGGGRTLAGRGRPRDYNTARPPLLLFPRSGEGGGDGRSDYLSLRFCDKDIPKSRQRLKIIIIMGERKALL